MAIDIEMTMKLILHIGSDKCGSTAIQRSLAINRDQLKEYGIYIPETGLRDNSGHACCFNHEHPNNEELFHDLVNELKSVNSSYESAIVSWEGIHFINESVLYEKYHLLRQFDTRIIYYVREQSEIIQTGILQQWKTHNCRLPFNKITPNSRMYHVTADIWSKFIGNKAEVAVYDISAFPDFDICLDFYSRVTPKTIPLKKSGAIIDNPSLSFEAAYLLAFLDTNFNISEDDRADLLDAICKSQSRSNQSKYFLSEMEVKEIRRHYEKSNEILKAEYGADLLTNLKASWKKAEQVNKLDPELLANSLELYDIPILKFNQKTPFKLSKALKSGWYKFEGWGAWANTEESIILFRLDDKAANNISSATGKIEIEIRGQYFKSATNMSDLTINGRTYNKIDLSMFRFAIDKDDLYEDNKIKIIIKNGHSVSELSQHKNRGDRQLSFGIKSIRLIGDTSHVDEKRKLRRREDKKNQDNLRLKDSKELSKDFYPISENNGMKKFKGIIWNILCGILLTNVN